MGICCSVICTCHGIYGALHLKNAIAQLTDVGAKVKIMVLLCLPWVGHTAEATTIIAKTVGITSRHHLVLKAMRLSN